MEQNREITMSHEEQSDASESVLVTGSRCPVVYDGLTMANPVQFSDVPPQLRAASTLLPDAGGRLPFSIDLATQVQRLSVQGPRGIPAELLDVNNQKTRGVKRKDDAPVKESGPRVWYRTPVGEQLNQAILNKNTNCGQALQHFKGMHPYICTDEMTVANMEGSRDLTGDEISQFPVENDLVVELRTPRS